MSKVDMPSNGVKISYAFTAAAALGAGSTSYQPSEPINTIYSAYIRDSRGTESVMAYDERLIDAKLEAVEARTETKFEKLLGELRVISTNVANLGTRIDGVSTEIAGVRTATAGVRWNILATGIALGALILGLFAYGQQMMQLAASLVGLKP